MIWTTFRLHLISSQLQTVHSVACLSHLINTYLEHTVDCTECLVTCEYEQSEHHQQSGNACCQRSEQIQRLDAIIREGASMGLYRITTLQTTNTTLISDFFAISSLSSFVPLMKVCEYRVYRVPSLVKLSSIQPSPTRLNKPPQAVSSVSELMIGTNIRGGGDDKIKRGSNSILSSPVPSSGPLAGGLSLSSTHYSIYTREKPSSVKVTKAGLLSHQLYGVDNTGEISPSPPLIFLPPLNLYRSFGLPI